MAAEFVLPLPGGVSPREFGNCNVGNAGRGLSRGADVGVTTAVAAAPKVSMLPRALLGTKPSGAAAALSWASVFAPPCAALRATRLRGGVGRGPVVAGDALKAAEGARKGRRKGKRGRTYNVACLQNVAHPLGALVCARHAMKTHAAWLEKEIHLLV